MQSSMTRYTQLDGTVLQGCGSCDGGAQGNQKSSMIHVRGLLDVCFRFLLVEPACARAQKGLIRRTQSSGQQFAISYLVLLTNGLVRSVNALARRSTPSIVGPARTRATHGQDEDKSVLQHLY